MMTLGEWLVVILVLGCLIAIFAWMLMADVKCPRCHGTAYRRIAKDVWPLPHLRDVLLRKDLTNG